MPLHSTIDPKSPEFAGNAEVMRGLVGDVGDQRAHAFGIGAEAVGGRGDLGLQDGHAHTPSAMISRPISQRRISLVPAPIS